MHLFLQAFCQENKSGDRIFSVLFFIFPIFYHALPEEWSSGHIKGLRAKGGFGVNIEWNDGKLTKAEIISDFGGECRLRLNCVASIISDGTSVGSRIEDGAIVFDTAAGKTYTVKA